MAIATISAKGWIVIPKKLREKYDLKPGIKVQFVDYGGTLAILPVPQDPVQDGLGTLKGSGSLIELLLEERAQERDREGRKAPLHS